MITRELCGSTGFESHEVASPMRLGKFFICFLFVFFFCSERKVDSRRDRQQGVDEREFAGRDWLRRAVVGREGNYVIK